MDNALKRRGDQILRMEFRRQRSGGELSAGVGTEDAASIGVSTAAGTPAIAKTATIGAAGATFAGTIA
jgi:hypothetical protein